MAEFAKFIWKDRDDEDLISITRENPILWDTKRGDYKDTVKKQRIIMGISSAFPGSSPMDIEKRFIALKEKFRREKKKTKDNTRSGSGAGHLMPKLEFLAETMRCRKTSSSILQPVNTNDLPGSDFFDTETSLNVEARDDNFIDIDNTPEITLTPNYSKTQLPSTSSAVSLQSTPLSNPADIIRCPPTNTKSGARIRDALFKESSKVLKQIGEAVNSDEKNAEELENHLKIFDYMGRQSFHLPIEDRKTKQINTKTYGCVFWEHILC